MNLILNRNFELPDDDWYQLAPLGSFPHNGAGITQLIDSAACSRMVDAFENAQGQSKNFPGLLIDFDHFSLDAEKHSEAAGWINGLQFRESGETAGLYANIRWSDVGEAAVKGGRYRFLSPVWAKTDCEDLGENRLRPIRLLNAAVTNDPNLKGILPLSNRNSACSTSLREENSPSAQCLMPSASPSSFENTSTYKDPNLTQEELMKAIVNALLKKLDLPPEADAEIIQSAIENITPPGEVDALVNRAETAESKITDLEKTQLEADADAFLDEHADSIENRDEVRTQFIENRSITEALFKNLKAPSAQSLVPSAATDTRKPLHNRDSKIKATHNRDAQPASEAHAVKIRNRASEIQKTEGVGYPDAFRRAEQELTP